MNTQEDNDEMTEQELNQEIDKLCSNIRRLSPEQRAYKIIEGFFNADTLTEERCSEFKSWFAGQEYKRT